jgi:hypothetical protein
VSISDSFQPDIEIRVGQQYGQFGNGICTALSHLTNVFGAQHGILSQCCKTE